MVKYEGLFFDEETEKFIHSIEENRLEFVNDRIHCTFQYQPTNEEIFNDIVGKEYEIEIIGYACDGNNSGFEIKLPDELNKKKKKKDTIPHITASIKEGAKSINTKDLNFKKLDNPVKIFGKFGYWIMDEDENEYLSFDKYTY